MDAIFRHVAACNNARLPGERLPLSIGSVLVGYLDPALRDGFIEAGGVAHGDTLSVEGPRLATVGAALAGSGAFRWRGEAFDVRGPADGPVLGTIDRGALPAFGIRAAGVHLNALVRRPDGLKLWVARRAADKLLDPGKLDHLVAGGVSAGMTPQQTLLKEAEEEAGLPKSLLAVARPVGTVTYTAMRAEGLRRDLLHCYDVELPADFVPEARDGEVAGFELWPIAAVVDRVRRTDDFKFNVNLVLIALFQRLGLV